jgi:hypothetical protein
LDSSDRRDFSKVVTNAATPSSGDHVATGLPPAAESGGSSAAALDRQITGLEAQINGGGGGGGSSDDDDSDDSEGSDGGDAGAAGDSGHVGGSAAGGGVAAAALPRIQPLPAACLPETYSKQARCGLIWAID